MKDYPSIPKILNEFIGKECVGFRKLDGSQVRTEWSRKRGWHKWATRGGNLFSESDPNFGSAIKAFEISHAEKMEKAIVDNYPKCESAIAFLEFLGPHSFAGIHDPGILGVETNDPKKVVLFDVNIHKKGIIGPKEFVERFGHLQVAEPIYFGKLDDKFIQSIRDNLELDEGVVCKGMDNPNSIHTLWRCKIKTWAYLKKIQKFFGTSYGKYWE